MLSPKALLEAYETPIDVSFLGFSLDSYPSVLSTQLDRSWLLKATMAKRKENR